MNCFQSLSDLSEHYHASGFKAKPGERLPATCRVQLPRRQRGSAESNLKLVFSGLRSLGRSRTCASARAEYAARVRGVPHFLPKPLFLRAASLLLGPSSILPRAAIRFPRSSVNSAAKVFSPPFTRTGDECTGRAGILGSIPATSGSSEQR
jgi:hypothetical protein